MPVVIRPATEHDAEELTPIALAAFRNDALNDIVERLTYDRASATPEQQAEYLTYRTERLRQRISGANKYWYKAVDEDTGKAVGLTGIYSPAVEEAASTDKPIPNPEASALEAAAHAAIGERRTAFLGERQDLWYIPTMGVHPDHSGKGIATKLLAAVLQHPDQAGQDVFLTATAPAAKLYRKAGFQALDTIHLLDGTYDLVFMVYSGAGRAAS